MSDNTVTLKLFIDNKRGIVLLAEADKKFVDALCDDLEETSTTFDLLRQTAAAGSSVVNLCNSIDNLYLPPTNSGKSYCCLSCFRSFRYYVDDPMPCPACGKNMIEIPNYVEWPPILPAGIYMITDDLEIKPMSTLSMMNHMLTRLSVDGPGVVEEKVVQLSLDEVDELVRASLHSKKVLTDFFLKKADDVEADGVKKEEFVVVDGDEAEGWSE